MKKFILNVLSLITLLVYFNIETLAKDTERAVWIPYMDIEENLKGKSKKDFKIKIDIMFDNIKKSGFNKVVVHARPFSDAIYKSKLFPSSKFICECQGDKLDFDPLKIMIQKAHERGLKLDSWVNPFRVKYVNDNLEGLADTNPAKIWLTAGNNRYVCQLGDKGIWYNPAYEQVRNLIINGVCEIVKNYDVDGIHFDDYFYPTTNKNFDSYEYNEFLKINKQQISQSDWRMHNIDMLVENVYTAIKKIKKNVQFGISPQGNKKNNIEGMFINTQKWCNQKGYVDYICPQIYFGFKNSTYPFIKTIQSWAEDIKKEGIKLYIGLAAYKAGKEDVYAGDGKHEWQEDGDILQKQIEFVAKNEACDGFFIMEYGSLFNPNGSVKEIANKIGNFK